MAKHHSDETKAAVMAALLAGQSIAAVAETYHIPEGTVKYWSANLDRTEYQPEPTTKKEIGELIIGYLSDLLITLRAQLKVYADEKWLRQQSASEVAVLHGVLADKAIRLLEALAGDEEGETHNV